MARAKTKKKATVKKKYPSATKKVSAMTEKELATLVDNRIAQALGLDAEGLEELGDDTGVMATPSVLSTVRATVYVMC